MEAQSLMVEEHATAMGAGPIAADSFSAQDKRDVNGHDHDNDEDDEIYHLSSNNRRRRVLDERGNNATVAHNVVPVSYTHLDVYKRQVLLPG